MATRTREQAREYMRTWRAANLERHNEYNRKWRAANPERAKAWRTPAVIEREKERNRLNYTVNREKHLAAKRVQTYGTDGAELFEMQNGLCGICKTDLKALGSRERHLDHCHTTKKVRAWLCGHCNVGLGMFKDNTSRLDAAISYLKEHA